MSAGKTTSRRSLVGGLAGLGAAGLAWPGLLRAQAPNLRRIDVHHHVMSPRYIDARVRHGLSPGPGYEGALKWAPADSIAQMDRFGIATAMVSNQSVWPVFPKAEVLGLVRDNNDFAAKMRQDFPGRFGLLAAIPMPDIDASLREIEYAFDVLKADGIGTTTNFNDKWPGDPEFDPVFAELNRRKAVVFVHPAAAQCCQGLTPPVPDSTVEFMFDITRCIASLLYRGSLSRFPDIQWVFTHGGGVLPQLAERIDRNTANQTAVAAKLPKGGLYELQRLHFDINTTTSKPALDGLRAFVPITQLLFGTDFPFLPPLATVRGMEGYGFSEAELAALNRGNAERLFPRLRG